MVALWKEVKGFCFLLAASVALIATVSATSFAGEVHLTKQSVQRFLKSYPAVKAVAVRYAVVKGMKITNSKDVLATVISVISDKALKNDVETVIKPHGFDDVDGWLDVAQGVALSYAYLSLDVDERKKQRKIKKAIRKIKKNDFLPEKTKQKLIKAIRKGADVVKAPPAESLRAVKPFVPEIKVLLKK